MTLENLHLIKKVRTSFIIHAFILCLLFLGCFSDEAQQVNPQLLCPTILGNVTMREATVWCQIDQKIDVPIYADVLDSSRTCILSVEFHEMGLANCYQSNISGLEPGSTYHYYVRSTNNSISDTAEIKTQPLWQYRNDPPDLSIMLGSCAYINEPAYDRPGEPYGGGYEIFNAMAAEDFDAMIWLGDNIYLREVDFGSVEGYAHRYSHARSVSEMHSLLNKGVHYAIWDDHDFGPNDCDGSWVHIDWSQKAFHAFWPNPEMGIPEAPELNTSMVSIGDIDLFLLDNRTHRVNHALGENKRHLLGEKQFEWLLNSLKNSRARFKLIAIGGQMVSDAMIYENFAQFPEERDAFFTALDDLDIRGVVFLTGDRHNAELSKIQLPNSKNWVYDLTSSPLTSGSYDHTEEPNHLREPGTMVGVRNYGLLTITGPRKDRVLKMQIKSGAGDVIWERSISASKDYEFIDL